MAKKQKSKLLAMALCASVMAGLYANPVFAGPVSFEAEEGQGITISFDNQTNGHINPDTGEWSSAQTYDDKDGLYIYS